MRSALLALSCVLLICGCAQSDRFSADPPPAKTQEKIAASRHAVTPTVKAPAPESTDGGPADGDVHSWHMNPDRTIRMLDQNWVAGERMKVGWFRPARTKLEVAGRRLDAEAPPLFVETSKSGEEYRHMFQPSIMIFPTGGYWEITAKAAQREARFVVHVKDRA